MTLILIPGGIWEPMTAQAFWTDPGVTGDLQEAGHAVGVVERITHPRSWHADAQHVAAQLPDGPLTLIAGSNGCSVAAILAVALPRVERLVLAWPATCGDPGNDARLTAATGDADLASGGILRGIADSDLTALALPVAVIPADPPNRSHQRGTVDALLTALDGAVELPGSPETPLPGFPRHRAAFAAALDDWLTR